MSQEEFRKRLVANAAVVETWPVWKQNILQDSLSPTVPVPRTPVDNSRGTEQVERTPQRES